MIRKCVIPLLILMLTGCAHRPGGAPATPYEQVLSVNAQIAETNRVIATGLMDAQRAGLISKSQAAYILDAQEKVALIHQDITKILAQGPELAKANAYQLQQLIDTLEFTTIDLVARTGLELQNPQSHQLFSTDVQLISTLAKSLVTKLDAAGVL